jgi:hypothetical protein
MIDVHPAGPDHEIGPDCPVDCLEGLVSFGSFNRLLRGDAITVADAANLYTRDRLRTVRGMKPEHITELGAALIFAGCNLADHGTATGDA